MSKRTILFDEHKKLGAKIVDFAGWEMPIQYTGVKEEHLAVRKNAGLFDVSHMGTFEISGKNAASFLDYLTPSNNSELLAGKAQYSLLLKETGCPIDDVIIYRLENDRFFMVVNASNLEKDFTWIKEHLKDEVELKNLSNDFCLMAIQGPKTEKILSKLTDSDLKNIKTFHLDYINLKNAGKTLVARTGYTGEDGFEIFAAKNSAVQIWNSLIEAGNEDGIKAVGLGARDTLRLEMKYSLYGHELTEETNALEAGLKWVIKLKKPVDFIGKMTLKNIQEQGSNRKLIGFKMLDKAIPRHGYEIKADGNIIGTVTSGTFSPSLEIPIGIGYVEKDFSKIGSKIIIDIRGRERQAEVVKTPFI